MRGEYCRTWGGIVCALELPPRARRIPIPQHLLRQIIGTTSACAENTRPSIRTAYHWGNYLRVRGEYHGKNNKTSFTVELPPRARRIHTPDLDKLERAGTTSAGAENTASACESRAQPGNYLRVRGEYGFCGEACFFI